MLKFWQRKVVTIMKWQYEECDNVVNKLQYLTPGCGLIEIHFDKESNPYIRGIDGAPYFVGIPKDEEQELLDKIRKEYPHGFHSRGDVNFDWLAKRVQELAKKGGVQINSLEEYGCMMIDGTNYDAYKLEVEHAYIRSPIYIANIFTRQEFIIFRPYIQIEELGPPENIGCFQHKSDPTHIEPGKIVYFQDEIVSYKRYKYEFDSNKLIEESYGFKNNAMGFMYDSRFGKFASGGDVTHLK